MGVLRSLYRSLSNTQAGTHILDRWIKQYLFYFLLEIYGVNVWTIWYSLFSMLLLTPDLECASSTGTKESNKLNIQAQRVDLRELSVILLRVFFIMGNTSPVFTLLSKMVQETHKDQLSYLRNKNS